VAHCVDLPVPESTSGGEEVNDACEQTAKPPSRGGRLPLCGTGFSSAQWGDLEVGNTVAPPGDHTPLHRGLPSGVCPCPHYGYVFKGRLRCHYPESDWPDEVVETGDAYFFPAGHVLIYEEVSEVLELNPAAALQVLMDHIESVVTALGQSS
jgi:hypothetical protein